MLKKGPAGNGAGTLKGELVGSVLGGPAVEAVIGTVGWFGGATTHLLLPFPII